MATSIEKAPNANDGMVVEIRRHFQAPPALVFRIWSSPEHVVRWYGPEGCGLIHCEMDFRVGGRWRFCMSSGPGHEHWISGEYREVDAPSRLVFTYVNESDQHEMLVTIDFLAAGTGTDMHFRQATFLTQAERDGHDWGWNSTIDLLSAYLLRLGGDHTHVGQPRRDAIAEDFLAAQRRDRQSKKGDTADDRRPDNR